MIWLKNVNEFIEYKKWYYNTFLNAYRNRVNEFYKNDYDNNPDDFPFMDPTSITTIFRDYEMVSYLYKSDTGKDEYYYKVDEFESHEQYREIEDLPDHIKEKRLMDLAGITDYIEKHLSWYGESSDPKPSYEERIPIYQGNKCADSHYKLTQINNDKVDLTVKDDQFNILSLVKKVNDEEFQYELDESIRAYNAGLYLASTAVSAVTIETLLKITFIKHFSEEKLPRRYYILNLAEILHEDKIIDNRLFHRLKSFNELRKGASHSKTGKITEWDATLGLNLINDIAELLFKD